MRKPKRKKLMRQDLEKLLGKYELRIQRLAEEAYQVRQLLEAFDRAAQPAAPAEVVEEKPEETLKVVEDAITTGTAPTEVQ